MNGLSERRPSMEHACDQTVANHSTGQERPHLTLRGGWIEKNGLTSKELTINLFDVCKLAPYVVEDADTPKRMRSSRNSLKLY
jgi:hypothetical protein